MPANRMNQEEFFAKLAPLDADQRGKVLWNLYWRGTAAMRERIEGELTRRSESGARRPPRSRRTRSRSSTEVSGFVELAESGAYIAGDRRVSRSERTKWRVTFRRLATQAQSALHAADSGPAERAMELMIDLACHAQGCFRSEDPLEAARFVVSQAVSALWETVLDARGFAEFAARAVPQLVRWEREYGWSEGVGAGKVREQERPLAEVLASMLDTPDMWRGFADAYLAELDRIAASEAPPPGRNTRKIRRDWADSFLDRDYTKRRRTGNLARWNSLLLEHLTPTKRNGSRGTPRSAGRRRTSSRRRRHGCAATWTRRAR